MFDQARQVAAAAEALLVDEGWHAPEPVVEAEAVADDRREEAPEPQRSLFSRTEFMAGGRTSHRSASGATKLPGLSMCVGGVVAPCANGRWGTAGV